MTQSSGRPRIGAGVLLLRDGKCILGRRKAGRGTATFGWTGGGMLLGETPADCAVRETREETGIILNNLRLLCVSSFFIGFEHLIDISFISDTFEGEPRVMEPNKVEGWAWYALTALPSPLYTPVDLAVRSYFSGTIYNEVRSRDDSSRPGHG